MNSNSTNKPEIVFTLPAIMGGVASFNFNIINNSTLIEGFYSKVILMHEVSEKGALFTETFLTDEQILFEYSGKENQYHLQKRLNKLLGNSIGAIVTDNGLTMEAARRFDNPKTVFSLIHDYYYVDQQMKLGDLADVAIAHSSFFSDAVFASNPAIYANRTFYIPYGVKQLSGFPDKKDGVLNLVFLGRLEKDKGVLALYEIQRALEKLSINVNWTIIGKGKEKEKLLEQWKQKNISFEEPQTTEAVYRLLQEQDVFIFPTIFEGTPVSILECLSTGVITITHDLPGGIRDIVNDGIGFRCKMNALQEFVNYIEILNNNRTLLKTMQHNCLELAKNKYDVTKNADGYFELFLNFESLKRKQKNKARRLVKLDSSFFANKLTTLVRSFK